MSMFKSSVAIAALGCPKLLVEAILMLSNNINNNKDVKNKFITTIKKKEGESFQDENRQAILMNGKIKLMMLGVPQVLDLDDIQYGVQDPEEYKMKKLNEDLDIFRNSLKENKAKLPQDDSIRETVTFHLEIAEFLENVNTGNIASNYVLDLECTDALEKLEKEDKDQKLLEQLVSLTTLFSKKLNELKHGDVEFKVKQKVFGGLVNETQRLSSDYQVLIV